MKKSHDKYKSVVSYYPFIIFIAISLIFFMGGCVTPAGKNTPPAVSLEEAKKITATFEERDFIPPPRTINDITKILSQEKPEDLAAFQKSLEIADGKPPDTKVPLTLAKFYLCRGNAASGVGRASQKLEDYRLAVKYGSKCDFEYQSKAMYQLGVAEIIAGNCSHGIKLVESAVDREENLVWKSLWTTLSCVVYANRLGDLAAAQKALTQAEKYRNEAVYRYIRMPARPHTFMDAHISKSRASVLNLMGRLREGEKFHRRAIAKLEPYKNAKVKTGIIAQGMIAYAYNVQVCMLAANLARQGRLIEAEIQARRAVSLTLKSHGRYSASTGFIIMMLNKVILEQGRYAEAEALARANLEIFRRSGTTEDAGSLAKARSLLAGAILLQGRWKEALTEYDTIQEALKNDPAAYKGFTAKSVNLWLALIKGGRGPEALSLVRHAFERIKGLLGEEHYKTAGTRGVLAMALAATGNEEGALTEFSKAIPILLNRSSRLDSEESTKTASDFRLGLILDAYIQLLSKVHGTPLEAKAGINAAAEAFRLSDVVRGQTVKRALAASSARAAAKDPALADLARREQDALTQIGALNGLLSNVLSLPTDQQSPGAVKDLRSRIDRLKSAREALMKEIEARFPDYANLVNPKPPSIEEARSNLRPGESLIATYVGEGGSYVWAIPHQGPAAFSSTGLDEKKIAKMVKALRASLNPQTGALGEIPAFDLETGYRLYERLLKPVETGWKDAKNLLLVAHGALGFLPFSVLPTKSVKLGPEKKPLFSNYRTVPWLARTHTVTGLPSVASLRTLRNIPEGDPGRKAFTGFGNPYFSPAQVSQKEKKIVIASAGKTRGIPVNRRGLNKTTIKEKAPDSAGIGILTPLPDTADEVRGIALALKADLKSDVFLGKAASEEQVKSMDLSWVKVLAFATHGLLPGELDGLSQPALALSSPKVTGGRDDGLLTMGEILALKLNADWVVLSACNTGAGKGAGAEAVSGLGRAFFYAGTRALLVSNWPVETTSAKTMTTDLFRRQAADPSLSRSEALNNTMIDLIDRLGYMNERGKMVFSYAHPIFWAPFSLVGDGG